VEFSRELRGDVLAGDITLRGARKTGDVPDAAQEGRTYRRGMVLRIHWTWPLLLAAAFCLLAAGGRAHAFAARAGCGIAGARTVASSGPLVVVTTPAKDVEACIGRRPAWQFETLNSADGPCRLVYVRASRGHVAAIDIRCELTVLSERVDEIVSFDVARHRILRGSRDAVYEHVSRVVSAADGAFALIEDFPAHSDVLACDHSPLHGVGGSPGAHARPGAARDPARPAPPGAAASPGATARTGATRACDDGARARHFTRASCHGETSGLV
jgi:hypothetical protein